MSPLAAPPERSNLRAKERPMGARLPQANQSKLSFVLLGVFVFLIIAGGFKMMTAQKRVQADDLTVTVVGANADLAPGCKLAFSSLHYLTMPKKYATSNMASSYEQLIGSTTSTFIKKGDPICKDDLLPAKSLSAMLPSTMRAITLKLDPEMLIDHELAIGDKVDVLVSTTNKGKKFTKTVCQNLQVLLAAPKNMMDSSSSKAARDANRVTLAASPADCEKLNQAADAGKVRLVLRSTASSAQTEYLAGADERDVTPAFALKALAEQEQKQQAANFFPTPAPPLAQLQAPAELPPAPAPVMQEPAAAPPLQWVVEMFSGSKRENYEVPAKQ